MAVLEQAQNLQPDVVLKDYHPCEGCEKMGALLRSERLPVECVSPKDDKLMIGRP
ncbi:hypothetical protein ACP70R_005238 [Stipagrostis hirtigluma subsp. patula]